MALTDVSAQHHIHACVVMPSPAAAPSLDQSPGYFGPPIAQRAVALGNGSNGGLRSNFWPTGSTVKVQFMGGSNFVRQKVMQYAQEWTRYANINFQFLAYGTGDIRISFTQNGSSWSMLGRQAQNAPSNRPTMNFGWFNERTPEYEFRRTVLHEFGHALGLLHEHQNPAGGIPWNEAAVYDFYRRTQGWDQQTTYTNVMARQSADETQYSAYDAESIMHYPVPPQLTYGDYEVGLNTTLSATDIAFISKAYPGRNFSNPATSTERTTSTSNDRPTTRTREEPTTIRKPVATSFEVDISNSLGRGVSAEVVDLYINNQKFTFRLQAGRQSQKTMRFRLRPGTYNYRIRSASVYSGQERVWNGSRYVNLRKDRMIYGDGSGRFEVKGDSGLVFYGRYDDGTGRMKVWLGVE